MERIQSIVNVSYNNYIYSILQLSKQKLREVKRFGYGYIFGGIGI